MNSQISYFYGITISMFYSDHEPPHIYAYYQGQECRYTIEIEPKALDTPLPRRANNLVCDWIEINEREIAKNWALARNHQELLKVIPLR